MNIEPLEILKWVGLVLAAGFIGYFGRYLAMLIIGKMREKELHPPSTPELPGETPPSPEIQLEETRLKFEKKKAKQEVKRAKKAGK